MSSSQLFTGGLLILIPILIFISFTIYLLYKYDTSFRFWYHHKERGQVYYRLHKIVRQELEQGNNPAYSLFEYLTSSRVYNSDEQRVRFEKANTFWTNVINMNPDELIRFLSNDNVEINDIGYFKLLLKSNFNLTGNQIGVNYFNQTNFINFNLDINHYDNNYYQREKNDINPISTEEQDAIVLNKCIVKAISYLNSENKNNLALLIGNVLFTSTLLKCDTENAHDRIKVFEEKINSHPVSKKEFHFGDPIDYIINPYFKKNSSYKKCLINHQYLLRFFKGIDFKSGVEIEEKDIEYILSIIQADINDKVEKRQSIAKNLNK